MLRAEDLFGATGATMARVQAFLGLRAPFAPEALRSAKNRNREKSRSKPSAFLNATLDEFFAPYNEQLYEWMARRGIAFERWPNASGPSQRYRSGAWFG